MELEIVIEHIYTYFKSEKSVMKLENILNYHRKSNIKFGLGFDISDSSKPIVDELEKYL